jgi:hypothetical protein
VRDYRWVWLTQKDLCSGHSRCLCAVIKGILSISLSVCEWHDQQLLCAAIVGCGSRRRICALGTIRCTSAVIKGMLGISSGVSVWHDQQLLCATIVGCGLCRRICAQGAKCDLSMGSPMHMCSHQEILEHLFRFVACAEAALHSACELCSSLQEPCVVIVLQQSVYTVSLLPSTL